MPFRAAPNHVFEQTAELNILAVLSRRRSLGGNRRSLSDGWQRTAAAAMCVCGGGRQRAAGASVETESAAAGGWRLADIAGSIANTKTHPKEWR